MGGWAWEPMITVWSSTPMMRQLQQQRRQRPLLAMNIVDVEWYPDREYAFSHAYWVVRECALLNSMRRRNALNWSTTVAVAAVSIVPMFLQLLIYVVLTSINFKCSRVFFAFCSNLNLHVFPVKMHTHSVRFYWYGYVNNIGFFLLLARPVEFTHRPRISEWRERENFLFFVVVVYY